nr:terminase small subunit [Acidobacteriota bacterium]
EYVVDMNGTQAAIRAGFSENSANEQACHLLKDARVCQKIQELLDEKSKRTQITADYLTNIFKRIADTVPQEGDTNITTWHVIKAGELLARHIGYFNDKLEITDQSLAERMARARSRRKNA